MVAVVKESVAGSVVPDRREIIESLEAVHEVGVEYWARLSTDEFFAPIGEQWSPSQHVRHLTRSMTPLLPVLRVPRVALRMAFGSAVGSSRTMSEIEAAYTQALARGGTAGRFTPPPERLAPDLVRRNAIMDAHSETLRGLTQAVERWSEAQLDAHRLPHPLLGKLTIREMLLFTLLHNQHHVDVVERRRREAGHE